MKLLRNAHACQKCVTAVSLSPSEEGAAAYVAGWLEKKRQEDLVILNDEPLITGNITEFIEEVSRGYLTVPHACTYEIVRIGLSFMTHARFYTPSVVMTTVMKMKLSEI